MNATPGVRRRVVILIPSLNLGGSETQVVALASGLDPKQWEVSVLTFRKGNPSLEKVLSERGVELVRLPQSNPFRALVLAARYCRRHGVDILHAHLVSAQSFALMLKPFVPRAKLIMAVGDSLPLYHGRDWRSRFYDWMVFGWGVGADVYVFNFGRGIDKKKLPPSAPIEVIRNGVNLARFRPEVGRRESVRREFGVPSGTYVIGMIANLTDYKDFPNVIEAVRLVSARGCRVIVIVAGDDSGADAFEIRRAAQKSAPGCFIFLGVRSDVESLLPGFDIVCSSSYTEGLSNALVEAMASAIPCVATDVGDSAEIIGETGWIVPPRDSEALAGAIQKALDLSDERLQGRGAAARERVCERFGVERMTADHEALYRRLLEMPA